MGKITSSTTNRFGKKTTTQVRTNKVEDFMINSIGRLFGHKLEWRAVKRVEKRKLRKGSK